MREALHLNAKIVLITVVFSLSVLSSFAQQKVQFTQYMFNGLVINPAYAGAEEALSLTFIQRNQWKGIENAPLTQTLSAHTLVKKKKLGLGVTLVKDEIGAHKNLNATTNYAYHIQTGKQSYLSLGVQAGIQNLRSNYSSLNGASNDPALNNVDISETFFDFGAGVYFRSPTFEAGLSAPQLLPETVSLNDTLAIRLDRTNLFLFTLYKFSLSESFTFQPSTLLKYLPGLPLSYDVNINVLYRDVLNLGVSYRRNESVDFLFKAQVTPQLQVGYAYDHTIGDVARLSNGSHELMVQYVFRYMKSKVVAPR